jgi:hypothetical protein
MITNITKEEFSKKIESKISKGKNVSYIDAVIATLEDMSLDMSLAQKLLSQPLLEKIKQEGQELNILPKSKTRLPLS